jgi:hypothetical protein
MRIFKILVMLPGTLSLILLHNYLIKIKGIDLFQFISFVIVHGMWYSFCMKVLIKKYIHEKKQEKSLL